MFFNDKVTLLEIWNWLMSSCSQNREAFCSVVDLDHDFGTLPQKIVTYHMQASRNCGDM